MFRGLPKGKTKDLSRQKAKQLFPKEDFRRTPKCKKAHDGMCDALCLAEYIRRLVK